MPIVCRLPPYVCTSARLHRLSSPLVTVTSNANEIVTERAAEQTNRCLND